MRPVALRGQSGGNESPCNAGASQLPSPPACEDLGSIQKEMGGGRGAGVRGENALAKSRKRINLARSLRQRVVPAETLLWKALRNRTLGRLKFRRQHPIGPYVVDFACVACKIVVELDGESHLRPRAAHPVRTRFLEAQGWRVLRYWNTEVYDDLEAVKEAIYQKCLQPPSPPTPLPPPMTVRHGSQSPSAGGEGS